MAHDVFVSYSSKDKSTADAVCAVLEKNGVRCWVAPRDILPGSDWGESIIEAINGARVMVLVFSNSANASPQIKREVERAVSKGIAVIPLRIENVVPSKALEYFLGTPHWLDAFTPPLERHLAYLAAVARKIIAGPSPSAAAAKLANEEAPARGAAGRDAAARRAIVGVVVVVLAFACLVFLVAVTAQKRDQTSAASRPTEAPAERWLTSAEYQKFFEEQVKRGFYLAKVEGRLQDGRQEFRGRWQSGRGPCGWYSHNALSNESFKERDTDYTNQGFELSWKSSFLNEYKDTVIQAIWIRRCN